MPPAHANLDPFSLNQLREVLGNDFAIFLAKYLENAETLMESLRRAWQKRDFLAITHAAHALRSPSHQIGAIALKDILATIESHARKEDGPLPNALLDKTETEFLAVKGALEKIMRA